jgi:predicted O-methyltransferase YrrM
MVKKVLRGENFRAAIADATAGGYIVECGVGRGNSLQFLVRLTENYRIFGFDSFEGLPEDWKMNEEHTWHKGSFACNVPEIEGAELRVGWFADTLPVWKKEHPGRIALLHIDSDLYSSCVTVLEELNDQIIPGTVIVSDDHFYKPSTERSSGNEYVYWEQGQYKAFNEWLEKYDRKAYLLSRGILGQAAFRIIQ